MRPITIGFGLLILYLLVLFRIGEVNLIKGDVKLEVIVAIAALIFFFVGLYFNYHLQKKAGLSNQEIGTALFLSQGRFLLIDPAYLQYFHKLFN